MDSKLNSQETEEPAIVENSSSAVCYEIGGGWGDAIEWTWATVEILNTGGFDETKPLRVQGWKQRIPREGDKVVAHFVGCDIEFEFSVVEGCGNPRDMFFADVMAKKQIFIS